VIAPVLRAPLPINIMLMPGRPRRSPSCAPPVCAA
jgi:hypothetical protein